jgi:hypothetical protein
MRLRRQEFAKLVWLSDRRALIIAAASTNSWSRPSFGCSCMGEGCQPVISRQGAPSRYRDAVSLPLRTAARARRTESNGWCPTRVRSCRQGRCAVAGFLQPGTTRLLRHGFGRTIYTLESTGPAPGAYDSKPVKSHGPPMRRHPRSEQRRQTRIFPLLRLPLLLETICSVFIPTLPGADVHFATGFVERVGA